MGITARNYAAQAQRALLGLAEVFSSKFPNDASFLLMQAKTIDLAIKFALPDGGFIINDELRGIEGQDVRLPFPHITVEYFKPETRDIRAGSIPCNKRLILASEFELAEGEVWIAVTALFFDPAREVWSPCAHASLVPSKWSEGREGLPLANPSFAKGVKMKGKIVPVLPEYLEAYKSNGGKPLNYEELVSDIADEAAIVLELLEALSCSNVSYKPIQALDSAKNAKRIKNGKLPMYETYELYVEGKGGANGGNGDNRLLADDAGHNSPRQHLRRGHIRVLQSGRRVWVNACIVGNPEVGVIEKSYSLKKANFQKNP